MPLESKITESLKQCLGPGWAAEAANGDTKIEGTYCYHEDFQGFKGHFPGQPVVPGVCQVDSVLQLLQIALHKRLRLEKVRQASFLRALVPGDEVHYKGTFRLETGSASFVGAINGEPVSKFKLTVKEEA